MAKRWKLLSITVCGVGLLSIPGLCNSLTLTAAGVADGFTLSTFATTNPGNTGCCNGPFGIAVASGNVIVNTGAGTQYVFSDVDGQTVGSALITRSTANTTAAYATVGGQAYGSQPGQYVAFKPDGTVDHVLTGVAQSPFLGLWGNPINGHIIAQSGSGLIDIDPLANGGTGSSRLFAAGVSGDGVTVSPDGKTAYLAIGGQVVGYNIATGAQTFVSGGFSGLSGPDGTGVISSSNNLDGDLIVNFNGNGYNTGGIGLLDPTTKAFTIVASGGTRGDYVSPDTTNGTLFLDYSDTVERLSCGPNCSIGGPMTATPEPGTVVLLGTGLSFVGAIIRRRRS